MGILLSAQNLARSYPTKTVFSGLSVGIHEGDRIGLVGANGAGKSTLLRILAGLETPDEGHLAPRKNLKTCFIEQENPFSLEQTPNTALLAYASQQGLDPDDATVQVAVALSQAGFERTDLPLSQYSGGWQKRVSLARALIGEPDLVLWDEPTNHLDWEGLAWLQDLLKQAPFAWLLISHDRHILQTCAGQIADLSPIYPDGIKLYQCRYQQFQEQRDEYLATLASQRASLANKVRREEAWLRSGVKARGTKSRSRIDEANRLIEDLRQLRGRLDQSEVTLEFAASGRKTKRLWVGQHLAHGYDGRLLFQDCNLALTQGLKLGILGPNGCGKSTLLKIIAGSITPQQGEIETAQDLRCLYFSQDRNHLEMTKTVQDNLCESGGDMVRFRGEMIHVVSWAKRFKLTPEHLNLTVDNLSGGEQARVALAKMMLQPADLLLLDEPTNDLDLESVETLEEALSEFPGAMVLVSHDRAFLENLCVAYIGFDGQGHADYFASVGQWQSAWQKAQAPATRASGPAKARQDSGRGAARKSANRLSYKDKRELEQMEEQIMSAEQVLAEAQQRLEQPAVIQDPDQLRDASAALDKAQSEVDALYARWAELEEKRQALES
jgi:ATP-binding cassette subfamily F protein uup